MMQVPHIYSVSQARALFTKLIAQIDKKKMILLTKGSKITAVLVDFNYLRKLQQDIEKVYQKTFIDKKYLPYTRQFSDKEINQWLEEDIL